MATKAARVTKIKAPERDEQMLRVWHKLNPKNQTLMTNLMRYTHKAQQGKKV